MKNIVSLITVFVLIGFLSSCDSFPPPTANKPYRPLRNAKNSVVIDTVEAAFQARQTPGYREDNTNLSNMSYHELLKVAQEKHGDNVDIYDITWQQTGRVTDNSGKWTTNEFSAFGKVVTLDPKRFAGIEDALLKASRDAMKNVSKNSVIAIIYITAQDRGIINYIADELEFILVKEGNIIADRSQLDLIRKEQNFQLNGEVDDRSAVSIGKILGANVIITGKLEGNDNLRRLRLRVLNVQTGQVIGAASEQL